MIWILVALNVGLILCLVTLLFKAFRRPQDDPRLSRGLQLLQSKISILEDISDRTELQVRQLITLMDQKIREVQQKIHLADKHVHLIKTSMEKSKEVAKIFEDRIPHQEIIERQTTTNYVRAAKMAHQGQSMEQIMAEVPLPRAELELLLKLNKQQLMFSEDLLPDWIRDQVQEPKAMELEAELHRVQQEFERTPGPSEKMMDEALSSPQFENADLRALGEKFRQACAEGAHSHPSVSSVEKVAEERGEPEMPKPNSHGTSGDKPQNSAIAHKKVLVQKVKFPRLQL